MNRSIAIAIGQSLFVNGLVEEIPKRTDAVSSAAVLKVGPTALTLLAKTPAILRALRDAYSEAIQRTMYFSLATACVALPFALGMQWLNVKKVAKEKEKEKVQGSEGTE